MTNYNMTANDYLLDFEQFSTAGIELAPEEIEAAVALSDRLSDPERQWQTYLNALALFGFETWLRERDNSLQLDSVNASVKQPSYASYIDGVFNLTLGEYRLCLLTNGVTIDELISVDRAVIDLPEYAAHFYVLVRVIEEQAEVQLDGFISHQSIMAGKQAANLNPDADWTYEIPRAWFNTEPDDLLLALRCLAPDAIAVPERITTSDNISEELESVLPQLRSGETTLPQMLTWSQGATILSNPDLLHWLYELQTTQPSITDSLQALSDRLSSQMEAVAQTVINVKSWLSDELDQLAQNLAWTLLPTPELALSPLRRLEVLSRKSPAEEFAAVITQLRGSGEEIPLEARGACQDFNLASYPLRMFAVTWRVSSPSGVPEWSLLLILGAQANNQLPQGLTLELEQDGTVLDQKVVTETKDNSYLYTQVIGELDEQFVASVSLPNGVTLIFPTFVFN